MMMWTLHFLPVYSPAWQFGGTVLSVSRLYDGLAKQLLDVRVITTTASFANFHSDQLRIPQNANGVRMIDLLPADQQVVRIRSRTLVEALYEHKKWGHLLSSTVLTNPLSSISRFSN